MFFPLLHCVSLINPLICLSPVFCSLTEENTLAFFQAREHSYSVFEIKTSDPQPEQFREAKQGKHLGVELMLPLFSASGKAIRARKGIGNSAVLGL